MDKQTDGATNAGRTEQAELNAIKVLADLCDLLDEYGPAWYSEEVHDRAQGALHLLQHRHGLHGIRDTLGEPPHTQNLCAAPLVAREYGDLQKSEKANHAEIHTARHTRGR